MEALLLGSEGNFMRLSSLFAILLQASPGSAATPLRSKTRAGCFMSPACTSSFSTNTTHIHWIRTPELVRLQIPHIYLVLETLVFHSNPVSSLGFGRTEACSGGPSMISPPERARPRRTGESYEEKCERRHETREALRRRSHPPSCRRPGRMAEELPQSPRQREFLRRRNLSNTTLEVPGGLHVPAPSPPGLLQVTPAPRAAPFLWCRTEPKCKVRMHLQKPRISLHTAESGMGKQRCLPPSTFLSCFPSST